MELDFFRVAYPDPYELDHQPGKGVLGVVMAQKDDRGFCANYLERAVSSELVEDFVANEIWRIVFGYFSTRPTLRAVDAATGAQVEGASDAPPRN